MPNLTELDHVAELAAVLATEPGVTAHLQAARDAVALRKLGRAAKRVAESRCNGIERYDATAKRRLASWTDEDEGRANRADGRTLAKAEVVAKRYGATVHLQGDPRGCVLKLTLASGRSNSFDRSTWGVG